MLGVCHRADPAYAIACNTVRRWPRRFRIAVQEGAPGLNPKVNQLVTLARRARHNILVISDSNARVEPDYLDEIAANFEDPSVGLVTHPLAGDGEDERGARLRASPTTCTSRASSRRRSLRRSCCAGRTMSSANRWRCGGRRRRARWLRLRQGRARRGLRARPRRGRAPEKRVVLARSPVTSCPSSARSWRLRRGATRAGT